MIASRFSRRIRRHGARPAVLAATTLLAGLAALTVLTACGSGIIAQTANQVPGVPGANVDAGNLALRNVVVQYKDPDGYPVGSSAPLVVRIFNNGNTPVTLIGAEAPDTASRVDLIGGAQPTPLPITTPSPSSSGSPAAGGSASPGGSASSGPSAPPAATPAPAPVSVLVGPSSFALLVPGQGEYLQLTGLVRPLITGDSATVTFHFSDGTNITVQVPVDVPSSPVPRGSAQPEETGAVG